MNATEINQFVRQLLATPEHLTNIAYFQTSGFSPKPEPIIDEIVRWTRYINQAPALPEVYTRTMEAFEATRTKVAHSLNAHADEIVLGENATIGINIIANGINWQAGDNVLLSTHEHPGNRIPWYNLIQRYGVELRFLPLDNDPDKVLEALPHYIDAHTKLVSLSHVSRRTGLRLPAAEITACVHNLGVPILWDGAQSYGAIPVDVAEIGCDFYTFSGHKYIMGPQGTGGFYVRRDRIGWIQPSWIGSHSQKDFDLTGGLTLLDEAKRFEFGTRNLADQIAFGKAIDLWTEIGWPNVYAAIAAYTDRMKAALLEIPGIVLETPRPYAQSSGIVTVSLPGFDTVAISASLFAHEKLLVSSLEKGGSMVRVSTHVFNNDEEIERLCHGIRRILQSGY